MIAAAVLLLLGEPGVAAQPPLDAAPIAGEAPEADEDCDAPQTQQRMNFCASLDFGTADAALNQQWQATAAVMKARDAALEPGDGQPGHFDTLLESQRAWLRFRDAQCLSESFMARGGSLQPLLVAQCKTYMTELRIQQLRDLSATP